jgi:hypothetical protein
MKTKFAIGCLVQWYEADIIEEYLKSLHAAVMSYDGEVAVDILLTTNQKLEQCESNDSMNYCKRTIREAGEKYEFTVYETQDLVTIADYRREFNREYCEKADVLVWGESDMIVPKEMFQLLDALHQQSVATKYIATFAICKMWDESWKLLEHPEFTDKPFIEGDTENWWNIPYVMSIDEMYNFNDKVEYPEVIILPQHKFNGCGLVISSEVIKAGVNIPESVFFVHEDTAFMLMTQKVLGNIPQYHFRNILMVHNRKHTLKRRYILGEESFSDTQLDQKRKSHAWYVMANKFSSENCYNLFNINHKSKTWQDVLNPNS